MKTSTALAAVGGAIALPAILGGVGIAGCFGAIGLGALELAAVGGVLGAGTARALRKTDEIKITLDDLETSQEDAFTVGDA